MKCIVHPKCAVTGARGFLGTWLCKALEDQGYPVCRVSNLSHAMDRSGHNFQYADVRYMHEIEPHVRDADIVFHLAAMINVDHSLSNPRAHVDTNIIGTFNMLELCRRHGFKLIIASSSEVYGTSTSDFMDEDHPLFPQSPYGASKAAVDMLALGHIVSYNLPIILLRCFNFTGPGQSWDTTGAVIPKMMKSILETGKITIFGSGEQERDYMDVRDAVGAYIAIAFEDWKKQCVSGRIYNAGSSIPRTINSIAENIVKVSGRPVEIIHTHSRPGEVMRLCCDSTRIRRDFKWEPKIEFEQTLSDMWKYYLERFGNGN